MTTPHGLATSYRYIPVFLFSQDFPSNCQFVRARSNGGGGAGGHTPDGTEWVYTVESLTRTVLHAVLCARAREDAGTRCALCGRCAVLCRGLCVRTPAKS